MESEYQDIARDTQSESQSKPPQRLVALAVARRGKLALALAGSAHWHETSAYVLMPAAIPGAALSGAGHPETVLETLDALARRAFGRPADVVASRHTYGPSAAHAIDRLPADPAERLVPLLRLERGTPLSEADAENDMSAPGGPGLGLGLCRVELRCYLAGLDGEPEAAGGPDGPVGFLWVTPGALRAVMRGMPFAEALALPGVEWQPAPDVALPEEAFVYVPGEYGERHLVRIAAKYGPGALFQDGGGR